MAQRHIFIAAGLAIMLAGCGAANVPGSAGSSATSVPAMTALPTDSPYPTPQPGGDGYPVSPPTPMPAEATHYPGPVSTPMPAEATHYPGPSTAPDATTGTAAAEPADDVLATWSRGGGIAGVRDSLTLYADGRAEIEHNGTTSTAQVPTPTMEELRSTFAGDAWKNLDAEYGTPIPDGFVYAITVGDKTVVAHDGTALPEPLGTLVQRFSAVFESGQ